MRTQVVRWQNACFSVHLALKEMISARTAGALDSPTYAKMVKTAGSKLCALPVCALTWLLSHRTMTMPPSDNGGGRGSSRAPAWSSDASELVEEFMRLTREGREEVAEANDVPYAKERTQLMHVVMDEMLERAGMRKPVLESEFLSLALESGLDSNLTEVLGQVWEHTCRLGRLDTDSARIMSRLLSSGGPKWFVSSLVDKLLSVAHEDDLKRQTDLLCGLLAGVDLPRCADVLLTDVLPSKFLLASSNGGGVGHYHGNGRSNNTAASSTGDGPARLADPHGSALAKLTATCVLGVLVPHHLAAKSGAKTQQAGKLTYKLS